MLFYKYCNSPGQGYLRQGAHRSSSNYGTNLARTCEVLDLETRKIIFGGTLRGPDSHLQIVTLGMSESLVAFAKPSPVEKDDMVIWRPSESEWNQDFPVEEGSTWPARFG